MPETTTERSSAVRLALGPLLGLAGATAGTLAGLPNAACMTIGVTLLCASWWIGEALPLAATSLLPFVLFPLLGVLSPQELAGAYGHPVILLLLGGFLLSVAVEHSGTHLRLAFGLLRLSNAMGGRSGSHLVLAFMATSALLSMWISNSATTLMLLPVALAVVAKRPDPALGRALLLGIAYAASIGGLGTPIGTPPNAMFLAVYQEQFGVQVSFLWWMSIGVPCVVLLLPCAWWLLTRRLQPHVHGSLDAPSAWAARERRVLLVFALVALLWVTRTAPWGGWAAPLGTSADDGTIALLGAVAMLSLPAGDGQPLLPWRVAARIPWHLLLLFAGGIALAKAFGSSGLSTAIGDSLLGVVHWPAPLMILLVCLTVTFLTEITSNTATAALLLPLLAAASASMGLAPEQLMVPAALSATCAFMLPVGTAPNAIIYAGSQITTRDMARAGFSLNLLGAIVITLVCWVLLGSS